MWQMPQPLVEYLDNPHGCWEFDWIGCVCDITIHILDISSNINGNDFAGLAAMTGNFSTRETRKNFQCKLFKATLKQSYLLLCLLSNRISYECSECRASPRLFTALLSACCRVIKFNCSARPWGNSFRWLPPLDASATMQQQIVLHCSFCQAITQIERGVYVARRTGWMTGLIRESWGWLKVDLNFKHAKYPREVGVNLNT